MFVRWTNRFWSVSLEHTQLLDFLKLFVNMHLTVSFAGKNKTHFLHLRIKGYGCLKFQGEVWVGRACAGANEEELTTCANFWRQEVGRRRQGNTKKGTYAGAVGDRRPLVAPGRATGRRSAVARLPGDHGPQRATTSSRPLATRTFGRRGFFLVF
jgi:hypothetical protein